MKRDERKQLGAPEEPVSQLSDKGLPLYRKLKESLSRQIEAGLFTPGQLIPSERTLCLQHGISRITVRRCISEMIHEGVLFRKHGKGTFVARPKIKQGLARIVNFSQTVLELGMKPATAILSADLTEADGEVARVLGLPAGSSVLKLALLGKGDEEPLVLYESFFLPEAGRRMVRIARVQEKEGLPFSTYDLYAKLGVLPATVNQTFEAVIANERLSALMEVKKGSPILMIKSVFTDRDQKPLEFRKAMYRGDRYKFHIIRDFSV
ncbi:MAG: GntR family transcriptional regulator [Deltaproteobacteria bacterium]|nr:GntR family transcriptional regulator [Deltaproteobacteria bacterium]